MVPVIVRIGLRYVAAALVAKGIFTSADAGQFSTDPDVANLLEVSLGLAIGAATEAWYWAARKFGWQK
jgi:type III secretory pathway component EscT